MNYATIVDHKGQLASWGLGKYLGCRAVIRAENNTGAIRQYYKDKIDHGETFKMYHITIDDADKGVKNFKWTACPSCFLKQITKNKPGDRIKLTNNKELAAHNLLYLTGCTAKLISLVSGGYLKWICDVFGCSGTHLYTRLEIPDSCFNTESKFKPGDKVILTNSKALPIWGISAYYNYYGRLNKLSNISFNKNIVWKLDILDCDGVVKLHNANVSEDCLKLNEEKGEEIKPQYNVGDEVILTNSNLLTPFSLGSFVGGSAKLVRKNLNYPSWLIDIYGNDGAVIHTHVGVPESCFKLKKKGEEIKPIFDASALPEGYFTQKEEEEIKPVYNVGDEVILTNSGQLASLSLMRYEGWPAKLVSMGLPSSKYGPTWLADIYGVGKTIVCKAHGVPESCFKLKEKGEEIKPIFNSGDEVTLTNIPILATWHTSHFLGKKAKLTQRVTNKSRYSILHHGTNEIIVWEMIIYNSDGDILSNSYILPEECFAMKTYVQPSSQPDEPNPTLFNITVITTIDEVEKILVGPESILAPNKDQALLKFGARNSKIINEGTNEIEAKIHI